MSGQTNGRFPEEIHHAQSTRWQNRRKLNWYLVSEGGQFLLFWPPLKGRHSQEDLAAGLKQFTLQGHSLHDSFIPCIPCETITDPLVFLLNFPCTNGAGPAFQHCICKIGLMCWTKDVLHRFYSHRQQNHWGLAMQTSLMGVLNATFVLCARCLIKKKAQRSRYTNPHGVCFGRNKGESVQCSQKHGITNAKLLEGDFLILSWEQLFLCLRFMSFVMGLFSKTMWFNINIQVLIEKH